MPDAKFEGYWVSIHGIFDEGFSLTIYERWGRGDHGWLMPKIDRHEYPTIEEAIDAAKEETNAI